MEEPEKEMRKRKRSEEAAKENRRGHPAENRAGKGEKWKRAQRMRENEKEKRRNDTGLNRNEPRNDIKKNRVA